VSGNEKHIRDTGDEADDRSKRTNRCGEADDRSAVNRINHM